MKPKLKAPGTKLLKLKYDEALSNFAFKINLRLYTWAGEALAGFLDPAALAGLLDPVGGLGNVADPALGGRAATVYASCSCECACDRP